MARPSYLLRWVTPTLIEFCLHHAHLSAVTVCTLERTLRRAHALCTHVMYVTLAYAGAASSPVMTSQTSIMLPKIEPEE